MGVLIMVNYRHNTDDPLKSHFIETRLGDAGVAQIPISNVNRSCPIQLSFTIDDQELDVYIASLPSSPSPAHQIYK